MAEGAAGDRQVKDGPESPGWPGGLTTCHQEREAGVGGRGEFILYEAAPKGNTGSCLKRIW